jgi:hypothetical protein
MMAVLAGSQGSAALARGAIVTRFTHRIADVFAALAVSGWDAVAQIAVFLWMALVVAFLGLIAAGFLLA